MNLSFRTARGLRGQAEMLPHIGPKWKEKPLATSHPTKVPAHIFYHDPLECIQALLLNPLVKDYIHFTPQRVFTTAEKLMQVYSEWRTGDAAWEMQVCFIPVGMK